jgi:hypothetical protein
MLVLAHVLHGDGTAVAVDPLVAATLARRHLKQRPGALNKLWYAVAAVTVARSSAPFVVSGYSMRLS